MKSKKQSQKQSIRKHKLSDVFYVVVFDVEGPERERFYQEENGFSNNLAEATLFQSLESAHNAAREENQEHPLPHDPNPHHVRRIELGKPIEVVVEPRPTDDFDQR
jgi:hypothetical protein